jgi:hypothetical protein
VVIVEPAQGVALLIGGAIPINGLIPGLVISVAPRGIVPPLSCVVVVAPGFDRGDAVPAGETLLGDVDEQPLEVLLEPVVDPMPPPSNDEVMPVPPIPEEEPAIPDEEEVVPMQLEFMELEMPELFDMPEPLDIGPSGVGPKPPGSIEVAPSGIPAGSPGDVDPGVPSGDVAPSPGAVMTLCAKATPQLKVTAAAAMNKRRIGFSCSAPKPPGASGPSRSCHYVGRAAVAVWSKLREM